MEISPPCKADPTHQVFLALPEMSSLSHPNPPEKPPQLDDFCRICLLRKAQLRPLATQFSGVMIPEMLYKVTGTLINMQEQLPRVICDRCLVKLDLAYSIPEEFRKQEEKLRRFWWKGGVLVDELVQYQRTEESWRKTHSEEVMDRLASGRLDPVTEGGFDCGMAEKTMNPVQKQEPLIKSEPVDATAISIEILSDDSADGMALGRNEVEMTVKVEEPRLTDDLPVEADELLVERREFPETKVDTFDADAPSSPGESDLEQNDNDKDLDYVPEGSVVRETTNLTRSKTKRKNYYECKYCQMPFKYKPRLEAHEKLHELLKDTPNQQREEKKQPNFECKFCQKAFSLESRLKSHEATHAKEVSSKTSKQCELCPQTFRWDNELAQHMKMHEQQNESFDDGDGLFKCPKCIRTYLEKCQLEIHMKKHVNVESGIFKCPKCGHAFGTGFQLKRHMKLYEKKTDWQKDFEGMTPPVTMVREGKTFYKCRDCDKVFIKHRSYFQHARSHDVAKPDANLRLHQQDAHKLSIKEEPEDATAVLHCIECDTLFSSPESYEIHLQGHRGETAAVASEGDPSRESTNPASDLPSDFPILRQDAGSEESHVVQKNLSMDESQQEPHSEEVTYKMDIEQHAPVSIGVLESVPEWQELQERSHATPSVGSEPLKVSGFSIAILSDDSDDENVNEVYENGSGSGSGPSTSGTENKSTNAQSQPWTCELCGIVIDSTTDVPIRKHMLMHKNIQKGKFECEICLKRFGFNVELQQHRRLTHNLQEPSQGDFVECRLCKKKIKRQKFTFHLNCHNNVKMRKIVCEICDKAFGSHQHLNTHTKARVCEKARRRGPKKAGASAPSTT